MVVAEIAKWILDRDPRTSASWAKHATVVAARSLGVYERSKDYTDAEAKAIREELYKLFPPRGH